MIEQIKQAIIAALPDAQVYVDDPHRDGQHFEAIVVSGEFEQLSLVKQHQAVLKALKQAFDSDAVHALRLKTFTPEKWEQSKGEYRL